MTYQETIDYMYDQLPMFQREGKSAYKADLKNTLTLAERLGHPEGKFKSVHVAGTNGKGSVSHMIASVLQYCGYKTGLFTSPHLRDFRERIKINGEVVSEDFVIEFTERNIENINELQPSFFEMTTLMAFEYFAKENVDVAIIETGLGGRLDSTNIILPLVSVITNISYDHTDILGNTLQAIASEKAGIIKRNVPVIIGEKHPETKEVFKSKASVENAKIIFAENKYKATSEIDFLSNIQKVIVTNLENGSQEKFELDLLGIYQNKNIVTVLATLDELGKIGFQLVFNSIFNGLKNAAATTGLQGRLQVIHRNPIIIADIGHNEEGIKFTIKQISDIPHQQLHIVFGMVKDKDYNKVLSQLPKSAKFYFTKANIPRSLDENMLKFEAAKFGLKGESYLRVKDALHAAKANATLNDLIYIGGSTYVVAEII